MAEIRPGVSRSYIFCHKTAYTLERIMPVIGKTLVQEYREELIHNNALIPPTLRR